MKSYFHKIKWKLLTKTTNPSSIMFHIVGIVCIVWFLFRVLPKPDRIRYPCQQMSLTFAASYITFWGILWGAVFSGLAFWVKKAKYKTAAFVPVLLVASVLVFSVSSNVFATVFIEEKDNVQTWTPTSLDPMGIPKGAIILGINTHHAVVSPTGRTAALITASCHQDSFTLCHLTSRFTK